MPKIKVYHFHNGSGGGVLSVIKNLLQFSNNPCIENHVIYTINKTSTPEYKFEPLTGATSQQVFYYSPKWNFYYSCKQLAKLLPDDKAVIAAHDWMELGMTSLLGLKNPIVQFLHGDYDYYYQLANKNAAAVDLFICVAHNIAEKLCRILPGRKDDVSYLRFPVASVININGEKKEGLNIIFIGRLSKAKGYTLLPVIARAIMHKNIDLTWHIVGDADMSSTYENTTWDSNIKVKFYGNVSNEEVMKLLSGIQVLILPSLLEGTPMVIIEAMKAGVIPVVNNIEGGIQELITDNETGYKIQDNKVEDYVDRIITIIDDEELAVKMRKKGISLASRLFDPVINTGAIEDKILGTSVAKRKSKSSVKVYGSRLDEPWLPNFITKTLRTFNYWIGNR